MNNPTSVPPELSTQDWIAFLEYHRPPLRAGNYTLKLGQQVKVDGTDAAEAIDSHTIANFVVAGHRYSLEKKDIHAVFPPQGSQGPWYNVLPHIILERSTLPWERSPRGDGWDALLTPSWLALLVFSVDEIPEMTQLSLEDLMQDQLQTDKPVWKALPIEFGDTSEQAATVIDVPWKILKSKLPTWDDLWVNAHARVVEYANPPQSDRSDQSLAEWAVIMANQLAPPTGRCAVHLVSLEHRYVADPAAVKELHGVSLDQFDPDLKRLVQAALESVKTDWQQLFDLPGQNGNRAATLQQLHQERLEIRLQTNRAPSVLGTLKGVPAMEQVTDAALLQQWVARLSEAQQQALQQGKEVVLPLVIDQIGPLNIELSQVMMAGAAGRRHLGLMAAFDLPFLAMYSSQDSEADVQHLVRLISQATQLSTPPSDLKLTPNQRPAVLPRQAGEKIKGIDSEDSLSQDKFERLSTCCAPAKDIQTYLFLVQLSAEQPGLLITARKLENSQETFFTIQPTEQAEHPLQNLLIQARQHGAVRVELQEGAQPTLLVDLCRPAQGSNSSSSKAIPLSSDLQSPGLWTVDKVKQACRTCLTDESWRNQVDSRSQVSLTQWLETKTFQPELHFQTKLHLSLQPTPASQDGLLLELTLRPAHTLGFGFGPDVSLKDTAKVRLVSLYHWDFEVDANQGHLTERINALDKNDSALLRLPTEDSQHPLAQSRLQAGYVPLSHHLRNGGRTVSWYRSPLVPRLPARAEQQETPLPARCADELLVFDPTVGLFDTSYATAWELGRHLALADSQFATNLYQWKQAHRQEMTRLRRLLDRSYLPLGHPQPIDTALPDNLQAWLEALTRLEGVPFSHLIPDERLLPQESIRFFTIDPLWLECLRDGALSIGRVLRNDHLKDHAHNDQLPVPPRLSGCLIRSAVIADWSQLTIRLWHCTDDHDSDWMSLSHLEDNARAYLALPIVRQIKVGSNILLCIGVDPTGGEQEVNLLELQPPVQVLHFGIEHQASAQEAQPTIWVKSLRDPTLGKSLVFNTRNAIEEGDILASVVVDSPAMKALLEPLLTQPESQQRQHHSAALLAFVKSIQAAQQSRQQSGFVALDLGQDEEDITPEEQFTQRLKGILGPRWTEALNTQIKQRAVEKDNHQLCLLPTALEQLTDVENSVQLALAIAMMSPMVFEANNQQSTRDVLVSHFQEATQKLSLTADAQQNLVNQLYDHSLKQVKEQILLNQYLWRKQRDGQSQQDGENQQDGQVLSLDRLFAKIADRLKFVIQDRPVTAADFGFQMLDAPTSIRILRP